MNHNGRKSASAPLIVWPIAIKLSLVMPAHCRSGPGNTIPANGLFGAVAGVLFSTLKVNFQGLFSVANVLQIATSASDRQGLFNIEPIEFQRLAATVRHAEAPQY